MAEPKYMMVDAAPQPVAPYSHIVEADGWYFLTGQMPNWPDDPDKPLPDGIEAQTRRVMDNLIIVLNGAGLELSNVLQVRVFLREFDRDYAAMNDTYRRYFPEGRLPARTCVGVSGMAVGALIEIDMIARKP